jgi:hypothetical protein
MQIKVTEFTSNTITRPADTTAYASGDLVANSTTAGSVTAFTLTGTLGRGLAIQRVTIAKSQASVTNANFRVHFFKDIPTVTNGDNGAFVPIVSGYIGFVDCLGASQSAAFSDASRLHGIYVNNSLASDLVVYLDADQKIYALIEARAAYTPASAETFAITVTGSVFA